MGKKSDKKKLEELIKNNAKLKAELEKLGIRIDNLEKFDELSEEQQMDLLRQNYENITEGGIIITQPQTPVQCPEGQHWDAASGKCVPDSTGPGPGPGPVEGKDKWNIPFFHKSKPNGLFYEMSDDPKNDQYLEELDDHYTVSNGVITMKPDGPTSIGVGKYIRSFENDIGPASMKHSELEQKGYMYKQDDVRDLEYKCVMRIKGIGENGFSMSSTTGRHHDDPDCRGFAYMFNIEDPSANPPTFRFRKEQWHVHYVNSPEGIWTNKDVVPMALDGADWFGYGFCRYNSQDNKKVYLEAWICPPGKDVTVKDNWKLLKRVEDFNGHGWGDAGQKCGGVKDQFGPWSGPQNRLKTNATSGTVEFKCISFREIDPADVITQ